MTKACFAKCFPKNADLLRLLTTTKKCELTAKELAVLSLLYSRDPKHLGWSRQQLADPLNIDRTHTLPKILARLEQLGLIVRTENNKFIASDLSSHTDWFGWDEDGYPQYNWTALPNDASLEFVMAASMMMANTEPKYIPHRAGISKRMVCKVKNEMKNGIDEKWFRIVVDDDTPVKIDIVRPNHHTTVLDNNPNIETIPAAEPVELTVDQRTMAECRAKLVEFGLKQFDVTDIMRLFDPDKHMLFMKSIDKVWAEAKREYAASVESGHMKKACGPVPLFKHKVLKAIQAIR